MLRTGNREVEENAAGIETSMPIDIPCEALSQVLRRAFKVQPSPHILMLGELCGENVKFLGVDSTGLTAHSGAGSGYCDRSPHDNGASRLLRQRPLCGRMGRPPGRRARKQTGSVSRLPPTGRIPTARRCVPAAGLLGQCQSLLWSHLQQLRLLLFHRLRLWLRNLLLRLLLSIHLKR